MDFLTKTGIREKLEIFLEGISNNSRIPYMEDTDYTFIHIGEPVNRTFSKYQTFLTALEDEQTQNEYDKDIRQGNFSLSGK